MANTYKFNPIEDVFDIVQDISLMTLKGVVNTTGDLPLSGNSENDAYIVKANDRMYTWNNANPSGILSDWVDIGSVTSVDWSAITNKPTSTVGDIDDAVTKKHDEVHTHNEIDILDLVHDATSINGIPVDAPATGEDGEVLTYNETLGRFELSPSGAGDMLKSVYDTGDNGIVDNSELLEGSTKAEVQNHVPQAHTHNEIDILDLDHDATAMKGKLIDTPVGGDDGKVLAYNHSGGNCEWVVAGIGDMTKAVYDIGDNGIVDKAEALNDGSTGGGNNVTAQEARDHIDDIATNPHNVTANQIGVSDKYWLQTYITNTPSRITRVFGQSANALNPGFDVRLNSLKVQYYSEHTTMNKLRIRVYKWDGIALVDREILNITQSAVSIGYHNIEDNTPDTSYYDVDISAGDRIWMEVDDGTNSPASRVREITISVNYKLI